MQSGTHAVFRAIVLDGALIANGMPRWDDRLSPADADAIHAYLIDLQAKTRADELAKVKAYLAGRLELRLDETRYLASWIGTQEALHDRVMTPDEALAEIDRCRQYPNFVGIKLFDDYTVSNPVTWPVIERCIEPVCRTRLFSSTALMTSMAS